MSLNLHNKIVRGRSIFLPFLAFILVTFLLLCPAGSVFAVSFLGNGTEASPYKISNGQQLAELAALVNAGTAPADGTAPYASAYYELTAHVGVGTWTPIGTQTKPFKGRFDGQGYRISNLRISGGTYVGLFGYISGGAVKNLGVENVSISGQNYAGGIAGYITDNGSIANCYVSGSVTGGAGAGGIAGSLDGSISVSYSTADVKGSGDKLGGIAGVFAGGSISNCYSTGDVTDTRPGGSGGTVDNGDVGGIVGGVPEQGSAGSVTNCYSTGTVIGYNYVGGIAGNIYGNTSVNCSVALNPTVACTASGYISGTADRVFGYYPYNNKSANNYARSDMQRGTAEFNGETGRGIDITIEEAHTIAFWTVKAGWSADIWNFEEGELPTLKMLVAPDADEPTAWIGEEGTAENPYEILTAADLAALAVRINNPNINTRRAYRDKHYRLTADIDISDYPAENGGGWVPIGINRAYSFRGTFDGGGHEVSGLSISRKDAASDGDYEGLFGYVYTGTVKNLKVSGTVEGWFEIGGIASYLEGDNSQGSAKIVNCHSAVDVICWGGHTGGVVGYVLNGGVVENCGSSGTVEAQNDDAGGIAGILKSNSGIKNSYSTGKVIAPVNRVGGIAGALDLDCFVENCYSTGEIAGADYIGGIVGKLISSTVRDSYSTGAVYGLAGDVYIDGKTMSTGGAVDSGLGGQTVYVVLGDYVGGVAGELKNGKVVNCYSAGPVWGHKEVGGVVGTLSVGSIVQNSVAFNPSVRASLKDAGRVVGVFYNGATANSHAYSGMTNSEGAPFTGEAGADVTAVEAKSAVFWTAVFGSGEASAWTYDEGYLPLLKGVGGQTRKVPGEFDDEEVIDAKTGATSKHEGGGSGDGGNASGNENTGGGSGDSADTGSGGAGNNANTGDSNNGGGSSANAGGSSAAVPADQAAGVATMADSGPIILADGGTVITVPKNTAINRNTGVITVTDGGDVTLADGRTVIAVPPATTIDPERATMTIVSQGGGIVTLPVGQVGGIEGGVKVHVPDGSEIDLKTGVITLPDGGRIIFQSTDGAERSGSLSGDRAFTVTAGTTVSPATGVITVTNGGDVTLPDGSTLTAAPGTTIDPFTGQISQPDGTELEYEGGSEAGASSGGCDAGMAGFALIALALGAAAIRKTR